MLELLFALTLGALVVLVAHRLVAGVTEGTRRLEKERLQLDRAANARRWLVEAFGSLDVGSDGAGGFSGRPDEVEFATWLRDARARHRRDRLTLAVVEGRLMAQLAGGDPIMLGDSVTAVAFDYLLEPGAQATWVREWHSPVSAPLAVRVRLSRPARVDTLLFIVGSRG